MAAPNLDGFQRGFVPAPTFWDAAARAIEAVTDDEWHRVSLAPPIKALWEEILPLAALARSLDIPESRVQCRHLGSTGDCDGALLLSGDAVARGACLPAYNVEITTAAFPRAHYRREALGGSNPVFLGPEIEAVGKAGTPGREIVSRAVAVDGGAASRDLTEWVITAVETKSCREKGYPQPCILLVRAVPDGRMSLHDWAALAKDVADANRGSPFAHIYLVEPQLWSVFRAT